jgi:hypothetical protein
MCQAFQAMSGISAEVGLVQFLRRGSVNSTGLTSSGAGLHRAGDELGSGYMRILTTKPPRGRHASVGGVKRRSGSRRYRRDTYLRRGARLDRRRDVLVLLSPRVGAAMLGAETRGCTEPEET